MSTVLDTLITDRTESDLTNDTDKAYNCYKDLNRIEQACGYLAAILNVQITTKEWEMTEFRTGSQMERILGNIKALRSAYYTKTSTPATPSQINFKSIYQANDIEQILKDLGDVYNSMVSGYRRLSFRLGSHPLGNRR